MSASTSSSKLKYIWQTSIQDQWQRMEALEQKMEEAVMRKRRRIANLLDEMPSFRKSHLRLFISHKEKEEAASTTADTADAAVTSNSGKHFEISIEGKLLIGHLDHIRAKEVDDALYGGQVNPDVDPSDRSQYRGGISERESDTPIEPIQFTHFLDQFQADLYTVWQPIPETTPYAKTTPHNKTPTTKRQKGKRQSPAAHSQQQQHNCEESLQASSKTTLVWRREVESGDASNNNTIATSKDAQAFILPYSSPTLPPPGFQFHYVVAELQLWMRPAGDEVVYQPSPALAKALFPQHLNERRVPGSTPGKSSKRSHKKQKTATTDDSVTTAGIETSKEIIPLQNDIFVPALLTMKEIVSAFFHYVRFKSLQIPEEAPVVNCDKTLQSLLECERFNFADLQFLLTTKHLIVDATHEASSFTYIVGAAAAPQHIMSLDMDVHVPSLFHYRCRELLRRLKQREFEYTSSRTKARNWLSGRSSSDDKVRQLLEDCVTGQGYTTQHIGSWLALARASPDGSEARETAKLDAQLCLLLERAQHHATAAQAAWDVVEMCSGKRG
jgi:hypothetical protein